MKYTTLKAALLGATVGVALAGPALAEAQTFKITQVFPSTHWHMTQGIQVFMDEVTRLSNGEIKFEVYHAGQLGKEGVTVVTSGIAEMGIMVPSYEVEKLPLTSVVELPGFHTTSCEGTKQYWDLAKEGGALFETEYARLGVRPLYGVVLTPYEVQTNTRVVASVADMKGVKLRANGAMAKAVAALGGVPVQVTSNEFFDALSRGTVDGGMWQNGSTRLVGLVDVLNHTVKGTAMGAGSTFFGISEKVYRDLDDKTKAILNEAGIKTMDHLCNYLDTNERAEEAWLVQNGKLIQHTLSEADAKLWNDTVAAVVKEWEADLNSKGRPGTRLVEAYTAAAAAH